MFQVQTGLGTLSDSFAGLRGLDPLAEFADAVGVVAVLKRVRPSALTLEGRKFGGENVRQCLIARLTK